MSLGRIALTCIKIFPMIVVTSMILFQIPNLLYDFGPKEPVGIESAGDLSALGETDSVFASVRGKADLGRAATFSMHGVRYTYFLLKEYGPRLVVRTAETVDEKWSEIELHIGRLRPYGRMPFSRSVRAGFRTNFDVEIPDDAFFLARDYAPRIRGWTIGAVTFAGVLWCALFYFFFIHGRIVAARKARPASS